MVIPPLLLDDDDDDGEEVRNVSASVGDGRAKRRERMATMVEEILLARMRSFFLSSFSRLHLYDLVCCSLLSWVGVYFGHCHCVS